LPAARPGVAKRPRLPAPTGAPRCHACLAALPAAPPPDTPLCPPCREKMCRDGRSIAGYRIIDELGKGGMGVVHLALDPAGDPVALKTIKPGPGVTPAQIRRFLREARIVNELDHAHIVKFLDQGEADGRLYFAMEYVRGTDAGRMLKQCG